MLSGVSGISKQNMTVYAARGVSVRSIPATQTGTPVLPVSPVKPVRKTAPVADDRPLDRAELLRRWETDPAAYRIRNSIIPENADTASLTGTKSDESSNEFSRTLDGERAATLSGEFPGTESEKQPGTVDDSMKVAGLRDPDEEGKVRLPGQKEDEDKVRLPGEDDEEDSLSGEKTESAQEVAEESECETCKNRKYKDGSDDPGVSFKTPSHIDPDMAASAVRGHEMEHVVREQASARREGRRVVSQSVTYHTGICPECGRVYVSGGTTRTTTAAVSQPQKNSDNNSESLGFFAVA